MNSMLTRLVALVGIVTIVSGLAQMVAPSALLKALHGDVTAVSLHLFRIIGMFIALFGGLLLHSYRRPADEGNVPLLYCACQKLGSVAAVSWAIASGLLSSLALGVAGFDLVSAIAVLAYARSSRS